jgi:hypothetical protein
VRMYLLFLVNLAIWQGGLIALRCVFSPDHAWPEPD